LVLILYNLKTVKTPLHKYTHICNINGDLKERAFVEVFFWYPIDPNKKVLFVLRESAQHRFSISITNRIQLAPMLITIWISSALSLFSIFNYNELPWAQMVVTIRISLAFYLFLISISNGH
jgi:hypothetical protein